MKHVVPFDLPHPVVPREDYHQIWMDVAGGEYLQANVVKPFRLARRIWRQDVIAHGRGMPFPEMAGFFARRSIYTPHNNFIGNRGWTKKLRSLILNRYSVIIAQTPYGRDNYVRDGIKPRKIRLQPIPVDYRFFSKPTGGDCFRKRFGLGRKPFVLVNGARTTKNPEVIMEACRKAGIALVFIAPRTLEEVKGYSWLLPPKPVMDAYGRGEVVITGKLPAKDVLAALDAATIYVNSADDGGECFCLVVYEAACAGVPLCLPDFGVFGSFEGCALFHNNHDADGLAENIRKYIGNPRLMKNNAEKARKVAAKFDYPIIRKQYERLCAEVFGKY
jgi:glycosyltransferase involved in cell wall biosynthesis